MRTLKIMRAFILTLLLFFFLVSCGHKEKSSDPYAKETSATQKENTAKKEVSYDKVDGVAVDLNNKGVGPVKSVSLTAEVDQALAEKGKEIYDFNCLACHKVDKKFVGPAPKGILERRAPEWIMNMILNPENMVKNDPVAKQLLMEYNGSPMANQGLTESEARAILEYFRTL